MPRQARIDAPGARQHIIVRGIERRKIFEDDADRQGFVAGLGRILKASGTRCYAWALMPNHAHLLLLTGRVPVATVMRRLLTGYAVTFNRRHRRHGHLFQNRYQSILCQPDVYLLELVRYLHLNPLRGHLVRALGELDRYPYAGHSALMGHQAHEWQDTDIVLGQFGRQAGAARRAYRTFLAEVFSLAPEDIFRRTKHPALVAARSVFCYWAVRELGATTAAIARRLGLTQPAISTAVTRGEDIARRQGLRLLGG